MENEKKFSMRFLFKEKTFRSNLTNLYLAVMTGPNAEILTSQHPTTINTNLARGTTQTKKAMFDLVNWLKFVEEISYSSDSAKQILEPVRAVSEFMESVKDKTTKLSAWVFSKSKPYPDPFSDEKRVTISMLVPSLQAAMSFRCTESEAASIAYGMSEFGELKPLPFVNRFRQFHPSNAKCSSQFSLVDSNFLKTSFDDLKYFSCSLEMEHYCEIASTQSKKRQLLGAPLICGGKVVSVAWPSIWISSANEPTHESEFQISEQLDGNLISNKIENFEGKAVRFLCVCWYRTGTEPASHPKLPELMHIEEANDETELIADDAIGFVRIRRKVEKEILMKKYLTVDFSKVSQLTENNGEITLKNNPPSDDKVIENFMSTTKQIQKIREGCSKQNEILLIPEDVLDDQKGSNHYLSKNTEYVPILLVMLKMIDTQGMEEFDSLPLDDKRIRSKALWWLKNFELVSKDTGKLRITPKGVEVAYQSQKKKIKEIIQSSRTSGIISIPELEQRGILPSLALKFLEEEKNNFKKSAMNGKPCGLFWLVVPSGETDENKKRIKKMFDKFSETVFEELSSVRHPLSSSFLIEKLTKSSSPDSHQTLTNEMSSPLSNFCANILLKTIENLKEAKIENSDWILSLRSRIKCLLKKYPEHIFSTAQLSEKIVFPRQEKGDVWGLSSDMKTKLLQRELSELSNQGIAVQIVTEMWTLNEGTESAAKKRITFVKKNIKNFIRKTMQNCKEGILDETRFFGLVGYRTRELCKNTIYKNKWKEIQKETITEMVSNDELVFVNGMCKLIQNKKGKDN